MPPQDHVVQRQQCSSSILQKLTGIAAVGLLTAGLAACTTQDGHDSISLAGGSHTSTTAPTKAATSKASHAPKSNVSGDTNKAVKPPSTPTPIENEPANDAEKSEGYCKSVFGSNEHSDPIRGYVYRTGADVGTPLSHFLNNLGKNEAHKAAAVVRVEWKELQPEEDGQVKAYRIVRKLQQLHQIGIDQVRLRIDLGGAGAPSWAIQNSGGGISVNDLNGSHSHGTAAHFWTKSYGEDVSQLVNKLGRTLDGCKPIKDISFTRNQVYTDAESDVLGVDQASRKRLESKGLNQWKYQQNNYDDIALANHAFPTTGFYIAIDTPAQIGKTTSQQSLELGKAQIDRAVQVLGKRAVLGNNSFGKNRTGSLKLLENYRIKVANEHNVPLSSQTATMERFGRSYMQVFQDASEQHFYSLELPVELFDKPLNQLPRLYQGR